MAPQETAKLDDILGQLGDHRSDFRVFRTEVLGGPEDDKPTGRLPRLEVGQADHEKRIVRIERIILLFVGAAALLRAFAWCADSLAHIVEVLHH